MFSLNHPLCISLQSVQSLSRVQLSTTPWTATCQASLSITNSQSLPKPTSKESVMPFNHLIFCHLLLLLPSIFPHIKVFSNESSGGQSIGVSASTSVLPMNTQDWLDLLAVQGTLKSLLQQHSSKALRIRWPKYWSFSFNISPSNEHSGLVGSPCSPRDSQESSPTPQFKSINSPALSFLYSPTFTSMHDHWKNHSLD